MRARPASAMAVGVLLLLAVPAALFAGSVSAEIEGFRLELASVPAQPLRDRETTYTLRLRDSSGSLLDGARVTLAGQMADGMTVVAPLRPGGEPGTYSGRVVFTMEGQWQLRARVVWTGKPFELHLTERVGP